MQPVRVKDLFELLHPLGINQVDLNMDNKTRCEHSSVWVLLSHLLAMKRVKGSANEIFDIQASSLARLDVIDA